MEEKNGPSVTAELSRLNWELTGRRSENVYRTITQYVKRQGD